MTMGNWVVGFCFDEPSDDRLVILIKKNRPEWQKGLLNGIGGSIQAGEAPIDAMVREFYEETGITTRACEWQKTIVLNDTCHGRVQCFRAFVNLYERWRAVHSEASFPGIETEEGTVAIHSVLHPYGAMMPNMNWLLLLHQDRQFLDVVFLE